MPEAVIRNAYTKCPFQILMYDSHGLISTGTGFFYRLGEESFLITNWHNLSGKHIFTREPLFESGRFPEYIKAKLATYTTDQKVAAFVAHPVAVFDDSGPVWYEHPSLSSMCDVVAIPLIRPANCPQSMHTAANLVSDTKIPVEPGGLAFVVGFPMSISVGPGLPLCKSGYIASEPHYDVTVGGNLSEIGGLKGGQRVPAFFLDAQTRPGMSGSPVFASYTGLWDTADPHGSDMMGTSRHERLRDTTAFGSATEFIGCYSGRVGSQAEDAALGLCWREDVIRQICVSKVRGVYPHVNSAG